MGDAGKIYVSSAVIPVYRELLCQATIITPNYFEVECVACLDLPLTLELKLILDC